MKDWTDRLNTPGINGIKPSPRDVADIVEGQAMLVPTPRQVDDFIRTIPEGTDMDVARAARSPCARARRGGDLPGHDRLSSAHRGRGRA